MLETLFPALLFGSNMIYLQYFIRLLYRFYFYYHFITLQSYRNLEILCFNLRVSCGVTFWLRCLPQLILPRPAATQYPGLLSGLPSTLLLHLVVLGGARGIEAVLGRVGAFASRGWCVSTSFEQFFVEERVELMNGFRKQEDEEMDVGG